MPVPRYDAAPVERPAGLVAPPVDLAGVTELRLHGVGGATPEQLLGDLAPQQVAGDRIAGFYRTADLPARHVEAYSWGGLTSYSGWRVLWVLLFPFALANVAGWMCTRRTHRRPGLFRLHRGAVRWACLGLTVNLPVILAMTSMDLLGYQCGGRPDCAGVWWLEPLRWSPVAAYPGRRLLLASLLPLAALALLAVLALRSIRRYEEVAPPTVEPVARSRHSAAQPGMGLADRRFWDGRQGALDLGLLHLAAGLAVLALVLAHTVHTAGFVVGAATAGPALWLAALVAGGVVLAGVLVLVARGKCPRWWSVVLLAGGAAAFVAAAWFAAAQPAFATATGNLPGLRNAANLAFLGIFGALLLVLLATVAGGRERGGFTIYGPLLALALAVAGLNAALLSVLVIVPRLLGRSLAIYPVVLFSLPYLVLVPIAAAVLFACWQLVAYLRAGGRGGPTVQQFYQDQPPGPGFEDSPGWAVNAAGPGRGKRARAWATRVARARLLASVPRRADLLLTVMVAAGAVILLVLLARVWLFGGGVWQTAWTRTLSALLGVVVPLLVMWVLRRGWRSLESRQRIGVFWDVLTFWPRAYHPFAPPSYAERAVPELRRRLWRIHDSGGRVVLAAHSQGSVLAAAALLHREEEPERGYGDRVALVTFGSPLGTLYCWAFPAYFNAEVLGRLVPGSGAPVAVSGWRSCYYLTDFVGRSIFPTTGPGVVRGVDRELPDPPTGWYFFDQPVPRPGSHSGYWGDPAVWREVDRLARFGR